ncbi:hypothetical protein, partial [Enterobacter intestinihominis]
SEPLAPGRVRPAARGHPSTNKLKLPGYKKAQTKYNIEPHIYEQTHEYIKNKPGPRTPQGVYMGGARYN